MEFIVENFELNSLKSGNFIKPYSATFTLNGNSRSWELVKASDSVAILIYNVDSRSFVTVRQFRPPLFVNIRGALNREQERIAKEYINIISFNYAKKIVTKVEPLRCYYRAEEYHQNYFQKTPEQAYCMAVVAPKVKKTKEWLKERSTDE